MTTKDTDTHNPMPAAEPLALRLIDGLGPLPEPAAEAVMDLCADHEGPVEAWQYLPADAMLYTANQMRAYATKAVAAQAAELEALRADAERYRFLRDAATVATPHIATCDGWKHYGSGADEVVDAARAALKEQKT